MVTLTQPNFTAGEISPLAQGRTDIAKYGAAMRTCRNWIIRPHGCLMNRPGTGYIAATKFSGASRSRLVPFVFSDDQSYELEFSTGFIRVYQNGAYTGVELTSTPYLEADLETLQYTQSADVLTVVCQRLPQREVRRTSTGPLTFVLSTPTYDSGPFLATNTDFQFQVYSSGTSGSVTLTSSANIFAAQHVGSLFRLDQENIGDVKPWESTKIIKTAAASPVGEIRRNDGKTFKCVAPVPGGGVVNTATGSVPPVHDFGVQMDGDGNKVTGLADIVGVSWLYMDSGYGIFRITAFLNSAQVTAQVIKQPPATVVGGVTTVFGPFIFSGDGVTVSFAPMVGTTSVDPTKYQVTVNFVIQNPTTYSVTPGGPIVFVAAPPLGVNNITVYQLSQNNRSSSWSFGAWSDYQGYPRTVTYFQDRIHYAGTTRQPQGVWSSVTGQYYNFGVSVPSEDDDTLAFFLNARQINPILDLIAAEALLAATSSAVWRVTDGQDEVLTPTTLGFKPQNNVGASADARSIAVGDAVIYAQNDGRRVRDLLFSFDVDKFAGDELSLLSEHLFPVATTISRLDYAQYPFSIVFALRDDGEMPTLSYLRDQSVLGWSPWDTDGIIEDVCSIPEGGTTRTYVIVRRTVAGVSVRYIERFALREFADIDDGHFVDCGITVDGRRTTSAILTGGVTWASGESMLVTVVSGDFNPLDDITQYGNEVWLYSGDDSVRLSITNYIGSANAIQCRPISDVPASLQGIATTEWTMARRNVGGLPHLNGNSVVICADALDVDPQVVGAGGVANGVLLAHPGGVVHVGLAYNSDLETLDFNIPGAEPIRAKRKTICELTLLVNQTRGLEIGPDEDHLDELPSREYEDYDQPPSLQDDAITHPIPCRHDQNGRVFIRQSSPLPVTITGLLPEVEVGQ